jgi:hypothetical protein
VFYQAVPIKRSSAASIDALVSDLGSGSAVVREAAIARLAVIGPRAVDSLVAILGRPEKGPVARLGALRTLEATADARALDPALQAALDSDASVAAAAVGVVRLFLKGRRGNVALDRLTALALDRERPETVRLAAVAAFGDLPASTTEPLWAALATDPSAAIRARASGGQAPASRLSHRERLESAAESGLPDDPETLRRLLSTADAVPLPVLHRIIERLRERESTVSTAARGEWTRARGAAHVALAKRGSRLALYDLRESLESARAPLPVEFLAALSMAGDASCLEAVAAACSRATDEWSRRHLADTFRAIVLRERLTRRHGVMKRIEKRWGTLPIE